jgi:copper chaperone CopZ
MIGNNAGDITPGAGSTVVLEVQGMTCGACEQHVRDALAAVPGVFGVTVSRETSTASVLVSSVPGTRALVDAVVAAGYDASVTRVGRDAPRESGRKAASGCGCCEVVTG